MNEKYQATFVAELYYHVYARSNDGVDLFLTGDNRRFFLLKFDKYITPVATIDAYCLMDNHVHFLIRLKSEEELEATMKHYGADVNKAIGQVFRQFFISYSTSFNRYHNRKGNLFQRPFRRILVDTETYFTAFVAYIHCNPARHMKQDYQSWKWSSYQSILSTKTTKLAREAVLNWFGGTEAFILFHQEYKDAYLDDVYWLAEME